MKFMRKTTYIIVVLMFILVNDAVAKNYYVSTSFHEPANEGLRFIYSEDGIHWDSIQGTFLRPMVGSQKVMRDPSIVKGPDGIFHLVWTSSWKGDRGFGYASSKDLMHWSRERFIEVMSDTTTVNTWAPELFYDDMKKQYLITWSSCVPGKFPDGTEEHNNNQRLYYTTTKDFKTFTPAKLFYDPGYSCIDATILKRGQNDYVMVVKDNTRNERNLKVAFAKSAYGPWSETSKAFTEAYSEGPTTTKVGDWYYIYYDSYRKFIFGAARTKDFVHFQNVTGSVKVPVGHKHGTIFMADDSLVKALIKENRDVVHYTGKTVATPERHDGGLSPVVGVHNIQIMRAEKGWTYNHQPMIAYWHNRFWIHYLSDPRSEHEPPGKTMLTTSADGYQWTAPTELFPPYNVPDGYTKTTVPNVVAKDLKAVMHQRVGFYMSKNGKLIAIGNYGVALTPTDDPNDGNGIGRVVREIKDNGNFGNIYFIYYNHGFNVSNTDYPYYKKSKDKLFVKACDEIIANPLYRMQWVEEADRNDSIIPLTKPYKAFCDYTLPDGRKVALWKHALTSMSSDGGETWREPVERAHGFVTSNAKIWGQRLSDGTYATVYNPAEYRWPLAISLSGDGLEYTTLNLINGEVTPERHGGNYKNYGPQYTRGIQEGNGIPKDGNLWVTYSMNKEDMWVSRIKVPVRTNATEQADEDFSIYKSLSEMNDWNIYSPLFAPVTLDGKWLKMSDKDPYDYAKVERIIPKTKELKVDFDMMATQNDHGTLNIDFVDEHGTVCSRLVVDSTATITVKGGARYGTILKHYDTYSVYHLSVILSTDLHKATFLINGKKVGERMFDTPVDAITRIVFRTGNTFTEPTIETPAEQHFDMPRADEMDPMATFCIANLKTCSLDSDGSAAVLHYDNYAQYAEKFNIMENENIVTDIPNSKSSEWMRKNIPLFDCPQKDMEEMYYYRWWSLRKHIERTPVGYGMTEFLVPRSYADSYNLIACAIGHHVMESRWIRDTTYLKQILRTWYRGNDGKAMNKMAKFSSWNPAAIYEAFKVSGDTAFILNLKTDLEKEYTRWKGSNRLKNGLYWQGDVQDGMEESISGGRKKKFARPTINSYMYGNACALAAINSLAGDFYQAKKYSMEADTIKNLIENNLWSNKHHFFETMRGDTLADVREAIGYLPWYFNMPTAGKYDEAWKQVNDEKGFSAPYGLTTAEQRHPLFRTHGTGKCEWDGAIWPFATSQTLTAMANFINNYPNPIIKDTTFFRQMELYVQSQHHRGLPYIGEYLDEQNGNWLMGDRERSRYYNHSTFVDLIITGLVGLRPQADGSIVINPLVPKSKWDYFCLDNVSYHGHNITILWDKTGQRYHQGIGFMLFVDGKMKAKRDELGKIILKK
jgi:hypothetical protein